MFARTRIFHCNNMSRADGNTRQRLTAVPDQFGFFLSSIKIAGKSVYVYYVTGNLYNPVCIQYLGMDRMSKTSRLSIKYYLDILYLT